MFLGIGSNCPEQMTCNLNSKPFGLDFPEDKSKKHIFKSLKGSDSSHGFYSAKGFQVTHEKILASDGEIQEARASAPCLLLQGCCSCLGRSSSLGIPILYHLPLPANSPLPQSSSQDPYYALSSSRVILVMILSFQNGNPCSFASGYHHSCQH